MRQNFSLKKDRIVNLGNLFAGAGASFRLDVVLKEGYDFWQSDFIHTWYFASRKL